MTFQTTSDIERRLAGRNETATYVGVLSRAVPAAKVALTDAMYLPIPSSVIDFSGPLAVGAAYARFSNRKQDRRSIGVQKESINSILPFWHARISDDMWFADEAKPGKKKLGREQLDEMLQCARAGGFRYLFVEDVSRLARSIGDMGTIREELLELGIEIISAFDGGVVSNMHIAFKGLHAADFLTDLTLRIKRSNVRLRREGFILGPPGFGFEPVPGDKGRPRLVAKQVEIVQAAFKMFVHEDLEYPEILKRFEELDYRWSDGTPFDQQRLKTLFVRILYAGCQVTDPYYDQPGPKVRRPLSEAEIVVIEKYRIVDRETVEASIAKVEAKKYGKKYAPALKHVLSGLVRCGNDQSLVAGERTEPRGNFLECRREGGCLCKWPVRAYFGEVLPGVLDAVGKAVAAPELRDQFVRDYNARAKQLELAQPTRAGELREIVKQIDEELAERGRVLHALSGSPVAFQASLAEIDGLELRKKGFQDELLAVGQDVAPIIARQDAVKIWNAAFAEMTGGADSVLDKASNPRLFDLFRQVVKGVVLERTPGPVPFSVTVEFSFAAFVVKANGAPFRESTTCLLPAPYKLIDLTRKTGYALTRPFEPDFAAGDFDDQTWLRIKTELGLPDFNRLAHDPRRAISGMFYKLRGGCIWKEVPERYRPSFLPFKLYQDMRADGSLARLLVFMKEEMPEQLSELSPEWVEKAISGRKLGNRDFSCRGQPPKSIKPRKAPVYNIKRSKSVDEHMEYIVHRLDGDPVVPAAQIWRELTAKGFKATQGRVRDAVAELAGIRRRKARKIHPFRDKMQVMLDERPHLTTEALHAAVVELGFEGSITAVGNEAMAIRGGIRPQRRVGMEQYYDLIKLRVKGGGRINVRQLNRELRALGYNGCIDNLRTTVRALEGVTGHWRILERFIPYILQRIETKPDLTAVVLWRELEAQKYTAGYRNVMLVVRDIRTGVAPLEALNDAS